MSAGASDTAGETSRMSTAVGSTGRLHAMRRTPPLMTTLVMEDLKVRFRRTRVQHLPPVTAARFFLAE
jgi:hypothetical protein